MLNAVQAPYALATPVVECVENALQARDSGEADQRVAQVIEERKRLADSLSTLPFVRHIWPSAANFFLVEVDDVGALMAKSRSDNILLRYFGGALSDCVRITVGTRDENDKLLQTLIKVQEV